MPLWQLEFGVVLVLGNLTPEQVLEELGQLTVLSVIDTLSLAVVFSKVLLIYRF